MKSSRYITNQLKQWNKQFDGIHIKYTFDIETNFHIVEISPEEIRRGNEAYEQQELDFWMDFMRLYPEENILISEPLINGDYVLYEN